jgi:uncharacterized Zn finger protein
MPIPKINESMIRQNASDKSFQRGEEYARSQAVDDLVLRGQILQASVIGNNYYRVSINFSDRGIESANCSCPYDFGGWCKHIVAVALISIEQPQIEERPGLVKMLDRLDLEQTRKLIQNLTSKSPDLVDLIDIEIELLTSIKENKSKASKKTSKPEIYRSPFVDN